MSDNAEAIQRDIEKKVTHAVLTHVMHRLDEFYNAHMPAEQKFAGLTPQQISTEFMGWLAKKDQAL